MQKSVWKENWEIGTVVLWKENQDALFARVFSPIKSNSLDEIMELILNIHLFRTNSWIKTGKELREERLKALENLVRLGQITKQLDPVSIYPTSM